LFLIEWLCLPLWPSSTNTFAILREDELTSKGYLALFLAMFLINENGLACPSQGWHAKQAKLNQ
jgi:hypothetical protein